MSIRQTIERLVPEEAVRRYLALLALLFAAAFPAGMFAPHPIFADMVKALVQMAGSVGDMPGGTFFLLVLMNNLFASLLLLLSGMLAGVLPVLSVGLNGYLMGMICRQIASAAGPGEAALEMIPHAAFEIPALLIVSAYGLWLGIAAIRRLRGKEEQPISAFVNRAVERYFTLAFPLLIAAAAAETFLVLRA